MWTADVCVGIQSLISEVDSLDLGSILQMETPCELLMLLSYWKRLEFYFEWAFSLINVNQ